MEEVYAIKRVSDRPYDESDILLAICKSEQSAFDVLANYAEEFIKDLESGKEKIAKPHIYEVYRNAPWVRIEDYWGYYVEFKISVYPLI